MEVRNEDLDGYDIEDFYAHWHCFRQRGKRSYSDVQEFVS